MGDAFAHVLHDADDPQRLAALVEDRARPRHDRAHRLAGQDEAELLGELLQRIVRRELETLRARQVVGMDDRVQLRERRRRPQLESEHPAELVRERAPPAGRVVLPAPDAGDALRLGELLLVFAELARHRDPIRLHRLRACGFAVAPEFSMNEGEMVGGRGTPRTRRCGLS